MPECDVCKTTDGVEVIDGGRPTERRRCPAHRDLTLGGTMAFRVDEETAEEFMAALARGEMPDLSRLGLPEVISAGGVQPVHSRPGGLMTEPIEIDRGRLGAFEVLADIGLASIVAGHQPSEQSEAYAKAFALIRSNPGLPGMLDAVRDVMLFMLPRAGSPDQPASALAGVVGQLAYLEEVAEGLIEHNKTFHPRRMPAEEPSQ